MSVNSLPGFDRRYFPRIDVAPPRKISGDISGELINVSEKGIGFTTPEALVPDSCEINIDLPSGQITFPVDVRWVKKDESSQVNVCGASVKEADEEMDLIMRKFMITRQFKYVAGEVEDRAARHEVLKFAKDFRDYIFDLVELDNQIQKPGVKDKDATFKKLSDLNNDIVAKGESLKFKVDDADLIEKIKNVFRSLVSSWIFKSSSSYRCLEKPKGYPGDYETLELIYDRAITSPDNELGYYFDLYFLNNPYAEAVR